MVSEPFFSEPDDEASALALMLGKNPDSADVLFARAFSIAAVALSRVGLFFWAAVIRVLNAGSLKRAHQLSRSVRVPVWGTFHCGCISTAGFT